MLTAEENITLPLAIAGEEVEPAFFKDLIAKVGLADRLTHRPAELSGGQQQRVAVARALVHRPAVLFADEPTGNLDSHSSEEVLSLLRQAVDEFQQTVIMVTHDAQAAAVADRIVVLRDGVVVHDGAGTDAEGVLDLMKAVA
jgi:putative ABC transport system ATP-binding protein